MGREGLGRSQVMLIAASTMQTKYIPAMLKATIRAVLLPSMVSIHMESTWAGPDTKGNGGSWIGASLAVHCSKWTESQQTCR